MIHSSRHVSTHPEIKPFQHLTTCPNKDSSAWTEVSVGTCPSRASIVAPGGRNLGDCLDSGRAGDT